jgi:hypothetical protein
MSELRKLVADELSVPVDRRVTAMAAAIAKKHGSASRAVLFYGSCLRERELDGRMLDFYLIVSDYRAAYDKRWLAAANRLIPPNVFYFEHAGLVSKYAVLSEDDFAHECSREARTVSTAARFAQPSRLVWSAERSAAKKAIDTVSQAAPTVLEWTLPCADTMEPLNLWKCAFGFTFKAEIRAERAGRAAALVDADSQRYEQFCRASLEEIARHRGVGPNGEVSLWKRRDRAARWWRGKQWYGKLYSVARLGKASLTFANGADYIVWKINRHAGTEFELKPWQQRHPLLAAITLLPKLIRSGAVR